MVLKLEAIMKKYNLDTEELGKEIGKLYKMRLQIPKKGNRLLLEDLRLYTMANDEKGILKNYYHYTILEAERKCLARYNNNTNAEILSLKESEILLKNLDRKHEQKVLLN
jgi:hypothetical protein